MAQNTQTSTPITRDDLLNKPEYQFFKPNLTAGEYKVKFENGEPALRDIEELFKGNTKPSHYPGVLCEFTAENGTKSDKSVALRSFTSKQNTDCATGKLLTATGLVTMTDPSSVDVYDAIKAQGENTTYVPTIVFGTFKNRNDQIYRGDLRALAVKA